MVVLLSLSFTKKQKGPTLLATLDYNKAFPYHTFPLPPAYILTFEKQPIEQTSSG